MSSNLNSYFFIRARREQTCVDKIAIIKSQYEETEQYNHISLLLVDNISSGGNCLLIVRLITMEEKHSGCCSLLLHY